MEQFINFLLYFDKDYIDKLLKKIENKEKLNDFEIQYIINYNQTMERIIKRIIKRKI